MSKLWTHLITPVLLGGLVFLTACSGPQIQLEPIPASANPTVEAAKLESELASARQQQLNVLSPTWFNKAEASLVEARALIEQKGSMAAIGTNVSRGRAELAKAQEMASIARTAIPEAIKGRQLARAAGAPALGQDYAEVEGEFLALTRAIEENNLNYAQRNQQEVVDAFRVIEIRAIKETTLGEVRKLLEQAEKEGAKKLAPQVLADAQQELRDVDAFISANPYAKEEMHQKASAALFRAKRLVQLTRQSEQFRTMQPIEVALWTEDVIWKISDTLGAADMRDQPFMVQVENILGTAGSLRTDREFLAERAKGQQAEVAALKTQQQEQLEALRQRNAGEVSALTARYDGEVAELVTKVAALEGKSREEQVRLGQLMSEQRAEQERVAAERRATEQQLAAEKRAAEEKLAAERRFNEQYTRVRDLFEANEAETYKQGQQMVLRLRGMSFPVGQSIIMPENYVLLSKVLRAIRTFSDPDLTIEGHTDSTGATEMNDHLSQLRAEAVKEYLVANGVTSAEKIAAVGYGPTRPLAPNTTAEGRAQNRRIDVVITPSKGLAEL